MGGIVELVKFGRTDAAMCRADWRRLLKDGYGKFEPFLEAVAGAVTGSYPSPDGNVRYDVRQHGKIWLGMRQDESPDSEDSPWLRLSREDVLLWRLNAEGRELAERTGMTDDGVRALNAAKNEGTRSPAMASVCETEIVGDYTAIRFQGRVIDLSKKYKARSVFRFLHKKTAGTDGAFWFEEIKRDFNAQFGKGQEKRQWKSDRFREDLFRGMSNEDFDCLFETLDQTAGRYRLKI